MLILPPNHAAQIRAGRRVSSRERLMIGGVGGAFLALVVVVVIALATGERTSANGCVAVNLPYSTGGAALHACGDRAKAMCSQVGRAGAFTGPAGDAVATQCRKAHVRVGSGS